MRYCALACDYDGTIAWNGKVGDATIAALEKVRGSGRKLVLVTGRQLDDLIRVFPRSNLFDRIVAENGALIYSPETRDERLLGNPPPREFEEALRARGAERVSVGRVIVATWEPYQTIALKIICEMGLELQVIFNKGAVMILPSGIDKGVGLSHALADLGLSWHDVVGVGDAENDLAFLIPSKCAVAVSNALDTVKAHADWVTEESHGDGVQELIQALVETDLWIQK
jgi:HAD superfamily hydrolase (TIGR01484 family)